MVWFINLYNGPFPRCHTKLQFLNVVFIKTKIHLHAVAPWHTFLCKYWQFWALVFPTVCNGFSKNFDKSIHGDEFLFQ